MKFINFLKALTNPQGKTWSKEGVDKTSDTDLGMAVLLTYSALVGKDDNIAKISRNISMMLVSPFAEKNADGYITFYGISQPNTPWKFEAFKYIDENGMPIPQNKENLKEFSEIFAEDIIEEKKNKKEKSKIVMILGNIKYAIKTWPTISKSLFVQYSIEEIGKAARPLFKKVENKLSFYAANAFVASLIFQIERSLKNNASSATYNIENFSIKDEKLGSWIVNLYDPEKDFDADDEKLESIIIQNEKLKNAKEIINSFKKIVSLEYNQDKNGYVTKISIRGLRKI